MKVEMDFYKNLILWVRSPAILRYVRVYLHCTVLYYEHVCCTVLWARTMNCTDTYIEIDIKIALKITLEVTLIIIFKMMLHYILSVSGVSCVEQRNESHRTSWETGHFNVWLYIPIHCLFMFLRFFLCSFLFSFFNEFFHFLVPFISARCTFRCFILHNSTDHRHITLCYSAFLSSYFVSFAYLLLFSLSFSFSSSFLFCSHLYHYLIILCVFPGFGFTVYWWNDG